MGSGRVERVRAAVNTWTFLEATGPEAERRAAKLESWLAGVARWHDGFVLTPAHPRHWTHPSKPMAAWRVALVSTAGVHLRSQAPFDAESPQGDDSFREIPATTQPGELAVAHDHYDHADAGLDINCIFPLQRLQELAERGAIGSVAPRHFGLMGFIPDPRHLLEASAPAVAERLAADGVDAVFLTPG